jgi:pSer/pThr/pTyr-binding forkhead associated (FHA) protein
MVRDLGSLNGTFVNNQRITEAAVEPGELLTVGTVTFRAIYELGESSASAPGAQPKAGKSDKTVREDKTVRAKGPATKTKSPAAPASPSKAPAPAAASDSEVLEFNFDQPLLPPGGDDVNVTERLDPTTSKKRGPSKPGAPQPAKSPATSKKDQKDETEKPAASSSDDDLTDFLESLEEK